MTNQHFTTSGTVDVEITHVLNYGQTLTLGAGTELAAFSSGNIFGGTVQLDGSASSSFTREQGINFFGTTLDGPGTLVVQPYSYSKFGGGNVVNAPVENNGDIGLAPFHRADALVFNAPVTGTGSISLYQGATLVLGQSVGAGQMLAFGSDDLVRFASTQAAQGFAGTLAGFAAGDTVGISGAFATGAVFAGDFLDIALSSGVTIALATSTALTGSLQVTNSGGTASILYEGASASLHDWSAAALRPDAFGAVEERMAGAGYLAADHARLPGWDFTLPART